MDGSAAVVAREDGLELDDTIVIGELDTTEEGRVFASLAGARADPRVNAGGVAVPDIDSDIRDTLAGRDVHILDLKEDVHAVRVLGLLYVGAHILPNDIVGAGCELGRQDARGVLSPHQQGSKRSQI